MQALDTIFFVLIGLLVLRGYFKGLTGELFSIASLAVGLVAALFFFQLGALLLRIIITQEVFQLSPLPELISFLSIFLIVFIAGKIAGGLVRNIIISLRLGSLDRFLGLFLGFAEAVAVITIVLFILSIQKTIDPAKLMEHSLFARIIVPFLTPHPLPVIDVPIPESTVASGFFDTIRNIYHCIYGVYKGLNGV